MINRGIYRSQQHQRRIKPRQGTGSFNAVPWPALLSLAAAALAAAAFLFGGALSGAGFSGAALAQTQGGGEALPAPGNLHQLHQPDAATPCGAAGLRWDQPPGGAAPQFQVQRKYGEEAQWQDSTRMDRPPSGSQSGYVVPDVQYPGTIAVVHYLSGTAADGVCDFRVRLTAGGKSGPWSELAVRPAVNRPPAFPARAVERMVAENLPAGANVGGPTAAADPDGDGLSYAIAGDDAASFSVDPSSGQITAGASLDYEEKSSYRFFLSAADGKRGADAVPVVVLVGDENDPPAFPERPTTRAVDENAPAGSAVGRPVAAADQDGDALTYRFHRRRLSDKFAIDPATGQITAKAPLDHESAGSYDTVVRVSDGRGGMDSVRLTISVRNVNEPGELAVMPPSPVAGTPQTAVLSDPDVVDEGLVSWTWERSETNRAPWTAIDGATSDGATSASYTPEAGDAGHYLRVTAAYADGHGGGNELRRKLGRVADAPDRNRPPRFRWEAMTRTAAENAGPGAKVGAPIAAVDPDGDPIAYVLSGNDAGLFSIRKATGQLKTAAALDYESDLGNQHTLTVTADDGRGGTDSVAVTVHVSNVNEPGTITLFPAPPRVGVKQKTILEDPDLAPRSPIGAWTWERASSPGGPWRPTEPPASGASYVPSAADAGLYLRVTAVYDDSAGTGNTASQVSAQVEGATQGGTGPGAPAGPTDGGAPTVSISGPPGPVTDFLQLDVVFSEPVTGLEKGDFVTDENVHVNKVTGSQENYTVYVNPWRNGEMAVSLPAGAVQDLDGNGNLASETHRAQVFVVRPQAEIYRYEPGPVHGPFEAYISFSEDVKIYDLELERSNPTSMDAGPGVPEPGGYLVSMERIRVENGMVTGLRSRHVGGPSAPWTSRHYVVSITPAGQGPVTVELLDWAGYIIDYRDGIPYVRGSEPARRSFETDLYRPSAVITGPDGPVSGEFEVLLTFSHSVTNFHASELAVTNGTAVDRGQGEDKKAQWRFTIVPAAAGPVTVSLPSGEVTLSDYATSGDWALNAEALKGNFASEAFTVVSG